MNVKEPRQHENRGGHILRSLLVNSNLTSKEVAY